MGNCVLFQVKKFEMKTDAFQDAVRAILNTNDPAMGFSSKEIQSLQSAKSPKDALRKCLEAWGWVPSFGETVLEEYS